MTVTVAEGGAVLRVARTGTSAAVTALCDELAKPGNAFDVVCQVDRPADLPLDLDDHGLAALLIGIDAAEAQSEMHVREAVAGARRATTAPLVLLVSEPRADVLAWATAVEVDDVLILPQTPETVAFAISKARRLSAARAASESGIQRGRIVTIFSPKGGTGKTVLTTNLAAALATLTDKNVLLVDLDLQFGDAAIMLGLDPERTLFTLVRDPGELDAGKLAAYVTRHRAGFDVLAAPVRPEEAELVTESKVRRLLDVASEAYDVVLVDTSPFFYGPMLALLDPTDELLVLSGLDVPTLKNVAVSLRTLELLGFSRSRTSMVLNRVAPNVGLDPADVERALGVGVRFEIPNDPAVAPAVNRGMAAVLAEPDSAFAAAIGSIAYSIAGLTPDEAEESVAPARRRWLQPRRILEGRVT